MILTKANILKDITIIEMQGEVQYCDKLDGIKLGKIEKGEQKCKLTIGNHNLKGKIENLSRPLSLIQKVNGNLQIIGIIKQKIIFSERPAPIPDHSKQVMKQLK
jgi:Ctf8